MSEDAPKINQLGDMMTDRFYTMLKTGKKEILTKAGEVVLVDLAAADYTAIIKWLAHNGVSAQAAPGSSLERLKKEMAELRLVRDDLPPVDLDGDDVTAEAG